MIKKALTLAIIILVTSLLSLFFGYPFNNILVINGVTLFVLATLPFLIWSNSRIKNKLLNFVMMAIAVIVELFLIGGFLFYLAWS